MSGTVTIQWCPGCKAWCENTRVANETLQGRTWASDQDAIDFHYQRAAHQCDLCGGQFVTAKPLKWASSNLWEIHAALTDISRLASNELLSATRRLEAACSNHHPELADFSAAVA